MKVSIVVMTDDVEVVDVQPAALRQCLSPKTQPPSSRQPVAAQPAKRSRTALGDKENQASGAAAAAPACKAAPVRSGLEVEDFGSQPAVKRRKRSSGLKEQQSKEKF